MSLSGRLYDAMHDALIGMEISQTGEMKDGPLAEIDYLTAAKACDVATEVALRFISIESEKYRKGSRKTNNPRGNP